MVRVKVNLTLDAEVARGACVLGLNRSHLTEMATAEAARVERNRLWREENRAALDAHTDEVAQHGLPLARFHSF